MKMLLIILLNDLDNSFMMVPGRRVVKLQTQEYYGSYACYLLLEAYLNDSSKTLVDAAELRVFSSVASVVNTYIVPLVLNGKMMTAGTSFFLTIWSKLSFWSILGFLLNAVPLNDLHLHSVLMVIIVMVVPEDVRPILLVVHLVPALLLLPVSFLNIKMNF